MNAENMSGCEIFRVSKLFKGALLFISLICGMLYAAALPPLNWSFAVFFTLLPLIWASLFYRWKFRLLCGWIWGLGWSVFSYNFLREIHPAVPYMLAPVISVWPALFTLLCGFAAEKLFTAEQLSDPFKFDFPLLKGIYFLFLSASLFTILEWTRCRLFVWNDLSVALWRCHELIQISRITGRYGVSFLVTTVNSAIFALIFYRRRFISAAVMLIYFCICLFYGIYRMSAEDIFREPVKWRCALIQADLPQQRFADGNTAAMAAIKYVSLSQRVKTVDSPDIIIWPECAVPVPYRENYPVSEFYRRLVSQIGVPMIIGSLDFNENGDMTNSALLLDSSGNITGKYDKFHRVPYGEYVPFREFLPESWINAFDMGRDLAAGQYMLPLNVNKDIRSGTAVCYEGVFSYLAAAFARNGANVLMAISNDVWYPESSEPEQHLANAVMRCVETGLPMIRCGNNGGSGVVNCRGEFTQYIGRRDDVERPELKREAAAGTVTVILEKFPELTMAVRYENCIVYLLLILSAAGFAWYAGLRKIPDTGR